MKRLIMVLIGIMIIALGTNVFAFDPGNQVPGNQNPGSPNPGDQNPGNQNPITPPSDNQASNSTINGTYSIVALHSGKALDVYDWGTANGTNIVQWNFWGGEVQQFKITPVDGIWHRITPVIASRQALDVVNGSTSAGANIQTWSYMGNQCQQFKFQSAGNGVYRIIARNSGMCLDVLNSSYDDGANVIQYNCRSGAENQMFELVRR